MKVQKPTGGFVEIDDEVVHMIQEAGSKGGAGGNRLSGKSLGEKHPWAKPYIDATGLLLKPNGKGQFKQAVTVQCQAGKAKVLTTSKFRGIDSVIPMRLGPAKTPTLVSYNYSSLKPCTEEFSVATSDLFQTHLCKGCRATIKSEASALSRLALAQAAKEADEAPEEEPEADADEPAEDSEDEV